MFSSSIYHNKHIHSDFKTKPSTTTEDY